MSEKLKEYNKKRDFDKTKEPKGNVKTTKSKALKFLIQYHMARRTHYDFRLEWNGVLLSWAVPKGPSYNPSDKRLAVKVEDHPLDYASFEGVIPKGQYGGGVVMLWDQGVWQPLNDVDKGLSEGVLKFVVLGKRIQGSFTLIRIKDNEKQDNWLLIKENDEYKKDEAGIEQYVTSITTGRTSEEIKRDEDVTYRKNPFESVTVKLAKLVDKIPNGDDYLYEVKYDGYRITAFIEDSKVKLYTRNGNQYTHKFKGIVSSLEKLSKARAMILDGEMIVTDDEGKSNFQALQNYIKKPYGKALTYMVFDILALDGEDLRKKPLIDRKKILDEILKDCPQNVSISDYVIGNGKECFEGVKNLGLEGIVGKKINSTYTSERDDDWIKIKCYKRQEFIIGGYTTSSKREKGISSLLLGVYEDDKFTFIGKSGTGLKEKDSLELADKFEKVKTDNPAFVNPPKIKSDEKVVFMTPKYIAEIQYSEITEDKQLRQASFKGLREDKSLKEIILEKAEKPKKKSKKDETEVLGVTITNPNKTVYKNSNVKKIDVINYYNTVSERMLYYMKNRVLSVVRCHKGIGGDCFFKKHPVNKTNGMEVITIYNSEGKGDEYFYISDVRGLITEAQMGTIEFHCWGSRVENLEEPDMMVFDLDPDEGMDLKQVRQGVKDLKKVLDELKLKCFLKTSGGKGYHVVVPFKPNVSWEVFHDFSKTIAELMESKWPDRYTSNIRKIKRKGKIFIDFVRNARGATSVAPYSLRARVGAKVSMPISFSELDKVTPNEIDISEAINRLKKRDPWSGFYDVDQKLN